MSGKNKQPPLLSHTIYKSKANQAIAVHATYITKKLPPGNSVEKISNLRLHKDFSLFFFFEVYLFERKLLRERERWRDRHISSTGSVSK